MNRPTCPALLAAFALTAGCSDRMLEDDAPTDVTPPGLSIDAPERGRLLSDDSVVVKGRVSDDSGAATVEVNGEPAEVGTDGRFEMTLELPPGVTLVETLAVDAAGNASRDTRAVMAGELAALDSPVADAMVALLNEQTFAALGILVADFVDQTDWSALAASQNPVLTRGGNCLGARMNVNEVTFGGVEVDFVPADGAIGVAIRISDLEVDGRVDFDVSCLGGSTGVSLRASYLEVAGSLALSLESGAIAVALQDATSRFDDLDVDVGLLPDIILDNFNGIIEGGAERLVVSTLEGRVADMAQGFLAQLTSGAAAFTVRGREVSMLVQPTDIALSSTGGRIILDSNVAVSGGDGMGYIASPQPVPDEMTIVMADQGFGVGVADDALNQGLASLWSSGVLDFSFALESSEGSGSALDDLVDRIDVHMLLPPYVDAASSGEAMHLAVGDLLVDVVREGELGDEIVTRIAVSASLELGARIDDGGRVTLRTSEPTLRVDLVDDGVSGANVLARDEIEFLATTSANRLLDIVDELVGELRLPALGGVQLRDATVVTAGGYLVVGGRLVAD